MGQTCSLDLENLALAQVPKLREAYRMGAFQEHGD
jgi:hypothetical protein